MPSPIPFTFAPQLGQDPPLPVVHQTFATRTDGILGAKDILIHIAGLANLDSGTIGVGIGTADADVE